MNRSKPRGILKKTSRFATPQRVEPPPANAISLVEAGVSADEILRVVCPKDTSKTSDCNSPKLWEALLARDFGIDSSFLSKSYATATARLPKQEASDRVANELHHDYREAQRFLNDVFHPNSRLEQRLTMVQERGPSNEPRVFEIVRTGEPKPFQSALLRGLDANSFIFLFWTDASSADRALSKTFRENVVSDPNDFVLSGRGEDLDLQKIRRFTSSGRDLLGILNSVHTWTFAPLVSGDGGATLDNVRVGFIRDTPTNRAKLLQVINGVLLEKPYVSGTVNIKE